MYLMINVIHTEVLKFIEHIFSINSVESKMYGNRCMGV